MSSIISFFKKAIGIAGPVPGKIAKERLSIMLVHQRSTNFLSDIDMKAFQNEIQNVVKKYLKISVDKSPQIFGKISS